MEPADKKYAIGMDVGGTNIRAGIVDIDTGDIGWEHKLRTPHGDGKRFMAALEEILDQAKEAASKIYCTPDAKIGMGSAGPLDPVKKMLYSPENIKCGELDLSSMVDVLLNDLEANVMGQWAYGSVNIDGKDVSLKRLDKLGAFAPGTGIGAAIVEKGKPYWGAENVGYLSVEIGNLFYNGEFPEEASIGKIYEHFGAGAGPFNIWDRFHKGKSKFSNVSKMMGFLDSREREKKDLAYDIEQFARQGDEGCIDTYKDVGRHLGLAAHAFVTMMGPSAIVFDGSIWKAFDLMKDEFEKKFYSKALEPHKRVNMIYESPVTKAGIKGSAYMALNSERL